MCTRSVPGVKWMRLGIDHPTSHLAPKLKMSRAILLPLCAFMACHSYLCLPDGVPVKCMLYTSTVLFPFS